jgi:hypothetical protein
VTGKAVTVANATTIGRERDKFVFILPILDGLICPLVIGAVARDWGGGKPSLFALERVEERARFLFAHLARFALRVGRLRGFVLALVRAGLSLIIALRLAVGRLGLLSCLIGLLLLVRLRATVRLWLILLLVGLGLLSRLIRLLLLVRF